MTRVLYTGAMGMFTAKVCSWCVSRLGGSAAWATRNTPPYRGFSSAMANGAAHSPMSITILSISPVLRPIEVPSCLGATLAHARVSLLLSQPHVLQAPVHPVVGMGVIVADAR